MRRFQMEQVQDTHKVWANRASCATERQNTSWQHNICFKYLLTLYILFCRGELDRPDSIASKNDCKGPNLISKRDRSSGKYASIGLPGSAKLESKQTVSHYSKPSAEVYYFKGNGKPERNFNNLNIFPSSSKQPPSITSARLVALLCAIAINVAATCYGFSIFERNNAFVDYNYPPEYQPDQSVNPYYQQNLQQQQQQYLWLTPKHLYPRQTNHDPLAIMSSAFGSFTLDQSNSTNNNPQLPNAQSWTSILNPFGSSSGGSGSSRPSISSDDPLDQHIRKILVPRVSGTPGNVEVRKYIVDILKNNNLQVELDEFTDSTPIGQVRFANIIASSNPNACRQLVLACHYDSKMMSNFLGAIDSAVPCAMLLRLAETSTDSYRANNADSANSLGLKFIFFDGEEAFVQWTRTDSLYGSRHLAAKWAKQAAPRECGGAVNSGSQVKRRTELDRIELFVLLDLIGTSDTTFVQYSSAVKRHYEALQKYEKEHIIKTTSGLTQLQVRRESAFKGRTLGLDFVEDDHVPFKQRGVPILLLLAHPFPSVWHTTSDNYEAIDFVRTKRILHVMEQFVANYSP